MKNKFLLPISEKRCGKNPLLKPTPNKPNLANPNITDTSPFNPNYSKSISDQFGPRNSPSLPNLTQSNYISTWALSDPENFIIRTIEESTDLKANSRVWEYRGHVAKVVSSVYNHVDDCIYMFGTNMLIYRVTNIWDLNTTEILEWEEGTDFGTGGAVYNNQIGVLFDGRIVATTHLYYPHRARIYVQDKTTGKMRFANEIVSPIGGYLTPTSLHYIPNTNFIYIACNYVYGNSIVLKWKFTPNEPEIQVAALNISGLSGSNIQAGRIYVQDEHTAYFTLWHPMTIGGCYLFVARTTDQLQTSEQLFFKNILDEIGESQFGVSHFRPIYFHSPIENHIYLMIQLIGAGFRRVYLYSIDNGETWNYNIPDTLSRRGDMTTIRDFECAFIYENGFTVIGGYGDSKVDFYHTDNPLSTNRGDYNISPQIPEEALLDGYLHPNIYKWKDGTLVAISSASTGSIIVSRE